MGIILFANKNAIPERKMVKTKTGRIKRINGIPAAFIATSSKLSPKFPKVIIEENNKERGNERVMVLMATSPTNCIIIKKSKPLPTKSSMYNQKNCMVSTKVVMVSAAKKGPIKAFRISMSNFLNNFVVLATYAMK